MVAEGVALKVARRKRMTSGSAGTGNSGTVSGGSRGMGGSCGTWEGSPAGVRAVAAGVGGRGTGRTGVANGEGRGPYGGTARTGKLVWSGGGRMGKLVRSGDCSGEMGVGPAGNGEKGSASWRAMARCSGLGAGRFYPSSA